MIVSARGRATVVPRPSGRGRTNTRTRPEEQLLENIRDLCRRLGLCPPVDYNIAIPNLIGFFYHTRDSRGSYPGHPDLFLINPFGAVLYRELKSARGKVTPEQEVVLELLRRGGFDVGVWRPADWPDRITAELTAFRRRRPTTQATCPHCLQVITPDRQ